MTARTACSSTNGETVHEGNARLGAGVTKSLQTEEQNRLQAAALDAAANAMLITDRCGVIQWVNQAFCSLTGYTAKEAIGRNPRELVKSGVHDCAFYRDLWQTIQEGRVWRGALVNRRKDGSLYTEEQAITPVRGAAGEITHFIAVKQDVTDRRDAEVELHRRAQLGALQAAVGLSLADNDSLNRALQECAEALVSSLDAALARVWTFNERERTLELQASAGLYTHLDGVHGKVPLGQLKIGRIALHRKPHLTDAVIGDPEVRDQEWARREGLVSFAGHPLIAGGRLVGVMALFARRVLSESVTEALASIADHIALGIERHRTAQALRASEARTRFALEAANVGIWESDCQTGVVTWSPTLEAQYGLEPDTLGGTVQEFIERSHPDDRPLMLDAMQRAEHGGEFTIDHRVLRPDGSERWLQAIGRVLPDANGKPARAVGVSLDITQRRSLEEQYRQAQKMEAIGRLAGGVAHDFNNLLTAILGYCDLIRGDAALTDGIRADVDQIHQAGMSASALTRQLLAFSRKQIIEPTLLDLSVVAAGMHPMLERIIGEDIKVVMRLDRGLRPVKADRSQLEQVIMNVAINARDAMPNGGVLTIETTGTELDYHYAEGHLSARPGSYAVLTVSDTGSGMSPEVQQHLFEPFFTTKEAGKGTGLGLATVHGIVTQNGGTIGVYSEVGRGTCFKIYLPCAEGGGVPDMVDHVAAAVTAGTQTVLVVEDAAGLRQLTSRLLEHYGYTVLVADGADEAVRIFEANADIAVVLTDVVMPDTSGPALAQRLLAKRPTLKVIYMSGYTADAIVHHGALNENVAFLHKPFTSVALARKVNDALNS
jgi:PAS domain S-box-containing protein